MKIEQSEIRNKYDMTQDNIKNEFKRLKTDKERVAVLERALIEIKEALNKRKTRVNMSNGISVQTFISCVLQDVWD